MQKIFVKLKQKLTKTEVANENESLKQWIKIAEKKQEFYCSTLGSRTWEQYRNNERQFLKIKLGFAIFGPPSSVNGDVYYKEPIQNKIIENIVTVIEKVSSSEDIYLAFVYVIGNVNGEYAEFPIIRVLKESDGYITHTSFFVDILGRLYKHWDDFLEDNIFPKCIYCYPKKGFYSRDKDGFVQLEFGYSPACKKLKRFVDGMDNISNAAMIASAAIGITSVAVPVAAPVLVGSAVAGVTSGVWTTARSTSKLVNRKKHGHPISFLDQDARVEWLSLVSGFLGAAGAGALHYNQLLARSGQVLSKVPSMIMSGLETGCSVSCGSLYIVNQIMTLIESKDLSSLDTAQFALSILFFFHTKIDAESLSKLLLKLRQDLIRDLSKQMDSSPKTVLEFILNEGRKQTIEVEGEIVKSLKVIDDSEDWAYIFGPKKESSHFVSSHEEGDWVIVNLQNN